MIKSQILDVCCFSYLAASQILHIKSYPSAGRGSEILEITETLSADGPIVACAAARLGLRSGLVSNNLGDDEVATALLNFLAEHRVQASARGISGRQTAKTYVLSDGLGYRTWFSFLPDTDTELETTDLSAFQSAKIVYIDLYRIIGASHRRAIEIANADGCIIYANLGGAPLTPDVVDLLQGKKIKVLQTSSNHFSTPAGLIEQAKELAEKTGVQTAIVTAGEYGSAAVTEGQVHYGQPHKIQVRSTNGAGATFTAAFIYSMLNNWPLDESISFANAAGAINCMRDNGFSELSLAAIHNLLQPQNHDK